MTWTIQTPPYFKDSPLAGYHYAEGPGDLRVRTNSKALLDRILWLLQLQIDPTLWPPAPKPITAQDCIDWKTGRGFPSAADLSDMIDKSVAEAMARDLPKTFTAGHFEPAMIAQKPYDDAAMMAQSERYVSDRDAAALIRILPGEKHRLFDEAQMRAAFRSGADYARGK